MREEFIREELLIGKDNLEKLEKATVAIFGVGGVGSYVLEGLVRAGIGNFILIDNDTVDVSNINRQIIATQKSIGKAKVEVAKERVLDINPNAKVEIINKFFMPDSIDFFENKKIEYVVDAIDTITSKIELVIRCKKHNIKIISSMGTGNKLNPSLFKIADIYDTSICPLCKVMRKELRKRNIDSLKVVYSEEEPLKIENENNKIDENGKRKRNTPGSISFVPSVAGLIIASEVVKDIINE